MKHKNYTRNARQSIITTAKTFSQYILQLHNDRYMTEFEINNICNMFVTI